MTESKIKKTIRFVCAYADGLCDWEFLWFPEGRRIISMTLREMQTLADLMGHEVIGMPHDEALATSPTFGVKGCPE